MDMMKRIINVKCAVPGIAIAICLVLAALSAGCTGPAVRPNTYTTVTVQDVQEKEWFLTEGGATFSCYLLDSNDVVYKVVHKNDCIRFRGNTGKNYTVVQDYDQKIIYAERLV